MFHPSQLNDKPAMSTTYTKEQVGSMAAGEGLDRLVGEHLLNLPNVREGYRNGHSIYSDYSDAPDGNDSEPCLIYDDEDGEPTFLPGYSTSIYWAWEVIKYLTAQGLRPIQMPDWHGNWHTILYRKADYLVQSPWGEEAPVGICKAALLYKLL